jgi:hypothetical protein
MMNTKKLVWAAGLVIVVSCDAAPEQGTATDALRNPGRTRQRTMKRPCRNDAFFVEVPLARPTPGSWHAYNFHTNLENALAAEIANNNGAWFCTGPFGCPTPSVTVRSALPQRSAPSYRADGHVRYLRVQFTTGHGLPLSVLPDQECHAVSTLRSAVTSVSGVPSTGFYVGRECETSAATGVQGAPDLDMVTWHLTELGLPPTTAVSPPAPASQRVDLAVIDSGLHAAIGAAGIGVASAMDLYPSSTVRHPHGSAMMIFGRQLAPNAAIHDLRALDWTGSGTSETLATALDAAMFSTPTSRALVVNMSLGWPSELSYPAMLTSANGCSTHEDPFGELVRYELDVARRMDASGVRRVFVTSAAGNQPAPTDPTLFPPPPAGASKPACPTAPESYGLYYPAEWFTETSCRPSEAGAFLSFTAGAVDDRLRTTNVAIPNAEPPLVAPGQHVYATSPYAPEMTSGSACGEGPSLSEFEALPRAFTGSSVSAALVSAAAARVQDQRLANGEPALGRETLERLLYLTGRDLCRINRSFIPVRILDIDRLDYAVANCPSVVGCADEFITNPPITTETVLDCATHLAACGLEDVNGSGDLVPSCASPRNDPVSWPGAYIEARGVCTVVVDETLLTQPWTAASSCSGVCPHEDGPQRSLVGSFGPQPISPICPDCPAFFLNDPPDSIQLKLDLSRDFEPGTKVTEPFLVVTGFNPNSNQVEDFYFELPDDPSVGEWAPGEHLDILVGVADLDIEWSMPEAIKATLVVTLDSPNAKHASKDYSALRVSF